MARPKSVVLTKEEKKSVITNLKATLKAEKEKARALAGTAKEADRALLKAQRDHAVATKANTRDATITAKAIESLTAQLAALTAPAAAA